MPRITVYSGPGCPYCDRAKALLSKKGAKFQEINVRSDQSKLLEMMNKTGKKSIPQIFIDDKHIGGCEELYTLDAQGGLDPLLKA
jgi:glutaredoxin 3